MADPHAVGATVLVDGTELDPKLAANVDQLIVDDDLHRPAMFAISIVDRSRDMIRRTGLRPGAEVEISIEGQGADDDTPLVKGDVVTVECDYDESGARVVVRGYASSHRLHRGRRTRTFHDATDSDIVTKVAREAGLELGEIVSTQEVHEQVTQANLTDWDFLTARARRLGLDLIVSGGALSFKERGSSSSAPADLDGGAIGGKPDPRTLTYGYNLKAFHGRVSAAEQVATVEVRGWDQDQKVPVVATASAATGSAVLETTDPSRLAGAFGGRTFVDVTTPLATTREAEGAATALAERIASGFAEVEGMALGSTALRAGVAVRVKGVSEEFVGTYVLSHTRHVIDRNGYRTHFTISGHHDRSLLGLVASNTNGSRQQPSGQAHPSLGLVRGLVAEIADPDKLGRVRVKLPWLDDSYSSPWAPVLQLGAGPESGTFFLPSVDDEVLVGFEHGQMDRPIVIGGLFNKVDQPPAYDQFLDNGRVTGRAITSRIGHELVMYDGSDLSGITLSVVDDNRNPVVSVALVASDKKVVIQADGAVDITAEGDINLKGKKITVAADGDLVLTGRTIKLN